MGRELMGQAILQSLITISNRVIITEGSYSMTIGILKLKISVQCSCVLLITTSIIVPTN